MSFDLIGSGNKAVAIIEVEEGQDGKFLAEKILKENKNVKSVLKKVSERKGEYRTREYELVAGDKNTEVLHKEFGCLLKLDLQKVYFSPREATERQRIAEEVKENEIVALFFAGIGAYAIMIAKFQPKVKKIFAIEINPEAVTYMKENIRINKVSHLVSAMQGDVKEVAKKIYKICDRVVMPLPLEAKNFLAEAISCMKENGVVNYYTVADEGNLSEDIELIHGIAKQLNRSVEILAKQKVLPYSPHKWRYRIDFKVI